MVKENKPKAEFEWRITQFIGGDLYTLIDWSNIGEFGELPPEYTNHCGQRFWQDGSSIILDETLAIGTLRNRHELKRGTVLEEAEFKAVELHLRIASERLHLINDAISEHSEHVIMEV